MTWWSLTILCWQTVISNPQMDGYEATRLIRKWEVDKCEQCRALEKIEYDYEEIKECSHHRIPIVAVTADVMKGTHEMCFSAGMDDYIPKVNVLPRLVPRLVYLILTDS